MLTSRIDRNHRLIISLEKGTWTSHTYREAVLKQIHTVIPYDAYCFTTVDPLTLLSTGAVTEDGIEAIHDRLFINEYMEEDIHKYAELIRAGEHTATLHTSNLQLEQSPRYINILQPAGFSDELRAVLVSGDACWGYLTLYRKTESAVFTEEERWMIQSWTASIASMPRSTSLTLIDEITSESPEEPGILITSDTFQLLSLNSSAQYWLSQLRMLEHVGPDVLPRPVRAVSSHLRRRIGQNWSWILRSLPNHPPKFASNFRMGVTSYFMLVSCNSLQGRIRLLSVWSRRCHRIYCPCSLKAMDYPVESGNCSDMCYVAIRPRKLLLRCIFPSTRFRII